MSLTKPTQVGTTAQKCPVLQFTGMPDVSSMRTTFAAPPRKRSRHVARHVGSSRSRKLTWHPREMPSRAFTRHPKRSCLAGAMAAGMLGLRSMADMRAPRSPGAIPAPDPFILADCARWYPTMLAAQIRPQRSGCVHLERRIYAFPEESVNPYTVYLHSRCVLMKKRRAPSRITFLALVPLFQPSPSYFRPIFVPFSSHFCPISVLLLLVRAGIRTLLMGR